jgi:spore maturation protein CgeB
MGAPTETKQDIEELCEIVKKIRPEQHSASTYTAYPGSLLYDYCIDNGLFVGDGLTQKDHYSMARFPYERKIVGVDYDYIRQKQHELSSRFTGALRTYDPRQNTTTKKAARPVELNVDSSHKRIKPKVSIITLSHNRPQFLPQAINSILSQTMKNWEMIIVDDFSTDPGVQDVLESAVRDPRIRAFKTNYDVNNISLLWNKAIDFSEGEYIALLDDDNRKKPTFCEEMSGYLDKHPEVDAVACFNAPFRSGDPLMQSSDAVWSAPSTMTKKNILEGNKVDSGVMMFRKSVIEKIGWFDERLRTEDDWDFVMRIVHNANGFGVVPKPLAEYRWHADNRVYHSTELGFYPTHDFIVNEKIPKLGGKTRVLLVHPDVDKITLSQNNVLRGIINAMEVISWADFSHIDKSHLIEANPGNDIVVVFMPFQLTVDDMTMAKSKGKEVVTYQCEDPHSLKDNIARAQFANYVFTNDISVKDEYEKIVGKGRCGFCPSISLDSIGLQFRETPVKKRHDVLFYGFAYESRVELLKQLSPKLKKGQLKIVGGGWSPVNSPLEVPLLGELTEQESIETLEEAKIVILFNRRNTDLGGNTEALVPKSVVRGYFEIAAGSLVMIDDERRHHQLGDNVVYYSNADDLAGKIKYYLSHEKEREAIAKKAKDKALKEFTYKKRISDLMNKIRSLRYHIEVL